MIPGGGWRIAKSRDHTYVWANISKDRPIALMKRAFIFVLDSFGIGGAHDASRFGDQGSDTLGHIAAACHTGEADRGDLRSGPLSVPNMVSLGLARAAGIA